MIAVVQFGFALMIQDTTIQIMNGRNRFSKLVRKIRIPKFWMSLSIKLYLKSFSAYRPKPIGIKMVGDCPVQTTEWSPCSRECGWGIRERITNDNEDCEMKKETKLCQLKPCHHVTSIKTMLNVSVQSSGQVQAITRLLDDLCGFQKGFEGIKFWTHYFRVTNTSTRLVWKQLDQKTQSLIPSVVANQKDNINQDTVAFVKMIVAANPKKLKLLTSHSSKSCEVFFIPSI